MVETMDSSTDQTALQLVQVWLGVVQEKDLYAQADTFFDLEDVVVVS